MTTAEEIYKRVCASIFGTPAEEVQPTMDLIRDYGEERYIEGLKAGRSEATPTEPCNVRVGGGEK